MDCPSIAKPNFPFRRMHVHIHQLRRKFQQQCTGWLLSLHQKALQPLYDRMTDNPILHRTCINKYTQTRGNCRTGQEEIATDLETLLILCHTLERQQGIGIAKHVAYPLLHIRCRKIKGLASIDLQGKRCPRMGQGLAADYFIDMGEFRTIGFKKFPAGRQVAE